ncbi:MAG: aspartate/glutamate racemase family protein [Spirochaetota bacterium]
MERAIGGRTTYGHELGILMLDTRFPRIPGDIGNALSFPFPVLYRIVEGASPRRVVEEADPSLLEPFVAAAKELEKAGARAITTSCGFLALFQRELSAAVQVPLFSSSLMQIPLLYEIFGRRGRAGVLTARSSSLGERHFSACGASGVPRLVAGMDDSPLFTRIFLEKGEPGAIPEFDIGEMEKEVVYAALGLVARDPTIPFIVLECTNMPPFREAIRRATGKPVFDIMTLALGIREGLAGTGGYPCRG